MTSELAHLLPQHRHEATLSNEERIRRIQLDRWISYPKAEAVLARMSELLAYPPHDRMPALLIYGGTGMGKTKILRKFIREFPAAFDDSVGITHMRVIHMQMHRNLTRRASMRGYWMPWALPRTTTTPSPSCVASPGTFCSSSRRELSSSTSCIRCWPARIASNKFYSILSDFSPMTSSCH